MKLTSDNIARIEEILTRYESGERTFSIAQSIFPNKSKTTATTGLVMALDVMRALGVAVPTKHMAGVTFSELVEFRAWKAAQEKSR